MEEVAAFLAAMLFASREAKRRNYSVCQICGYDLRAGPHDQRRDANAFRLPSGLKK